MAKVRALFMDVDGTLTDGRIYVGPEGEAMKAFDVKDGYAIKLLLPRCGIVPVILTGRKSRILENRCRELGIERVFQDCQDKRDRMLETAEALGLSVRDGVIEGAACIGDDLVDLPCLEAAEFSACPADAVEAVKAACDYVCSREGGRGAVREFIDRLIEKG